MRMIFGLVGILVTVGVIILVLYFSYLPHAQSAIKAGNKAKQQAGQMGGLDTTTGMRASDSIKLEPESSNGKLQSVLVTDVIPGGPMEKYFGLKRNDSIVQVGPLAIRDMNNDDELANATIIEAYQRQQPIVVVRDGEKVTLEPGGPEAAAAAARGKANPTAAAPDQKPAQSSDPLQRQLDTLQKIPTH